MKVEAGFCQQQLVCKKDLSRSLWGPGGEEDENFLDEGNCGDFWILALTDSDTVGSIGSNRRGYLLYSIYVLKEGCDDLVADVIWACIQTIRISWFKLLQKREQKDTCRREVCKQIEQPEIAIRITLTSQAWRETVVNPLGS